MKSSGFGNKGKKKVGFKRSHSCERLRKITYVSFVNKHIGDRTLDFFARGEADLQNCQTYRGVTIIFSLAYDATDQTDKISRASFNKNVPCHESIFFQSQQLPLLVSK